MAHTRCESSVDTDNYYGTGQRRCKILKAVRNSTQATGVQIEASAMLCVVVHCALGIVYYVHFI